MPSSARRTSPSAEPAADAIRSALRTVGVEREGLAALAAALEDGLGAPFARAVEVVRAAQGRVIVTGMGKSGHVGRKIAATMASTGTSAHYVHPGEASHGDLGMIRAEDVVLALSWSGETAELADIVSYTRRFRIPLVAITSSAESTLGREADVTLTLPKAQEACPNGLAPTTSTTMQLVLGDALAIALLEARGFSAQDFRVFHPGGKLGSQLAYVRAIMHAGERLPLVPVGTPLSEAVAVISDKRFGCVIVTEVDGRLAGVVTDGDLRRHMRPGVETLAVEAVMSRNARTVPPDTLVAEALELIESAKISVLIVVEDDRPVGLVHFLDLLRAGAA